MPNILSEKIIPNNIPILNNIIINLFLIRSCPSKYYTFLEAVATNNIITTTTSTTSWRRSPTHAAH